MYIIMYALHAFPCKMLNGFPPTFLVTTISSLQNDSNPCALFDVFFESKGCFIPRGYTSDVISRSPVAGDVSHSGDSLFLWRSWQRPLPSCFGMISCFSSHVFHTTPTDTSDQWTFFSKKSSRIFVYIIIYIIFIAGMICWNGDCNILEASEFLSWSSRFGIARDEGDNVYLVPKSQPILLRDGIGDIGKWLGVIYHPTLETLSFQVENSVHHCLGWCH